MPARDLRSVVAIEDKMGAKNAMYLRGKVIEGREYHSLPTGTFHEEHKSL